MNYMKMDMIMMYLLPVLFSGCVAKFASWNSWSACSAKCGRGWSTRERIVKRDECYTELSQKRVCEVKCQREKLSLNKIVTSSSVFLDSFPNSNAVDGNRNTDFYDGKSCTMTNKDMHPFLRIDLGEAFQVNEVVVYNRGDCCGERLNNFEVTVGSHQLSKDNEVCGKQLEMGNTSVTVIHCLKYIIGQYVHLTIPGPQFLSVCEVEVYGKKVSDCGDILHFDGLQRDAATGATPPDGWIMCYIDSADSSYYTTPCDELLVNIAGRYNTSNDLLTAGGNFGCWHGKTGMHRGPSYASNNVIARACRDNTQQHLSLSAWTTSTTTFGVCIKFPSPNL